jgi:exopolysaccharide production protein ExoZ
MLANIQALRAAAAILVVFVHMKPLAALASVPPGAMNFGNCGVDIFFVISGVIMVFTTERRETRPWDFLAHRIARITPLYWLITLVVFLTAAVTPGLVHETRASLPDLIRSLLFVPYVRPDGLMEPVVFAGWTLNYEMAFYVVFALALFVRPRTLALGLCVAVIGAAAAWGVVAHTREPLLAFYSYPMVLEFAAGVAIGWALPRLSVTPRLAPLAAVVAGASAAAALVGHAIFPDVDRALVVGVPAAVLVASALVLERAGWRVRSPLVLRLGDASYSIYLTHFFVAQAVADAAHVFRLQGPVAAILGGGVVLVGACVVGLNVFLFVETPLTRAARAVVRSRLASGRQVRVGAAAPARPEEA